MRNSVDVMYLERIRDVWERIDESGCGISLVFAKKQMVGNGHALRTKCMIVFSRKDEPQRSLR